MNHFAGRFTCLAAAATMLAASILAQSPSASPTAESSVARIRKVGTVSNVSGNAITLKADSGGEVKVLVQDTTKIGQLAAGQKATVPIQIQDVQAGDRMLVSGTPTEDGTSIAASTVVVMKQSDVAQKQQHEREEWQKNGVGGIVRQVNPMDGVIVITTTPKDSIMVRVTTATQFLRYAPDSVKFSDARRGTFEQIKAGDQLRARGAKSSDGKEVTADEIVSGTFQNIAGTITAADAETNTIKVKDVMTKKMVVVKITPDSVMRSLPAPLAHRIAMMLKGPAAGEAEGAASPTRQHEGGAGGRDQANGGQGGAPDFQRVLSRLPELKFADLQKDQAVIVVATEPRDGTPGVAITLVTGVEPILTASPDSSGAAGLFSSWNLSSSGDVQ